MVFAWLKNSKLIQLTLTEAKFKEFESWLKIETWLKNGWFHLK